MIGQDTYLDAKHAVEALDFSTENARIAKLQAEQKRLQTARTEAEARVVVINDILGSVNVHDGHAVAEALLNGSPAVPHEGSEALNEEKRALAAGIRNLSGRIDAADASIEQARQNSRRTVASSLAPLCEALYAEAAAGADAILHAHLAMRSMGEALRCNMPHSYEIADTAKALRTLITQPSVNGQYEVPREVLDALDLLNDKGAAVSVAYRSAVPI